MAYAYTPAGMYTQITAVGHTIHDCEHMANALSGPKRMEMHANVYTLHDSTCSMGGSKHCSIFEKLQRALVLRATVEVRTWLYAFFFTLEQDPACACACESGPRASIPKDRMPRVIIACVIRSQAHTHTRAHT